MSIDWDKHVVAPCVAVFGQSITYTPATGTPYPINGVFHNAYRELTELDMGLGAAVSPRPALGVRDADLQAPAVQGDQLTVVATGIVYIVKETRPDSLGRSLLLLNRVTA